MRKMIDKINLSNFVQFSKNDCPVGFFYLILGTAVVSHVITKKSNIYIDVGGYKKPLNPLKIQAFLKGDSLIH